MTEKPYEVIYKGRKPKIGVVLETGQKVEVEICPTRYLVKSPQYKTDKPKNQKPKIKYNEWWQG